YSIVFRHNDNAFTQEGVSFDDCEILALIVNVDGAGSELPIDEVKYSSTPSPREIDHIIGESDEINVSISYLDDYDFAGYGYIYVYIDNETRVDLDIDAEETSFSIDLSLLDDYFAENKTYSIVFRHNDNAFTQEGVSFDDCEILPLIVNVLSLSDEPVEIKYNSTPSPNEISHTLGESDTVDVEINYSSSYYFSAYGYIYAYIDNETRVDLDIDAYETSFTVDLSDLDDYFEENKTFSIVFRHNDNAFTQEGLSFNQCQFTPIIVTVISNATNPSGNETENDTGNETENQTGNDTENQTDNETEIIALYVSTSGDDNNNGSKDSPLATVSKAIELVKTSGINNIIILEGNYTENGIIVDESCTISGLGNVVFDAGGNDRVMKIDGFIEVKLSNLTMINGYAPTDAIAEDATHGEISVYSAGGAIFIEDAIVEMDNMVFYNNSADEFGGAINVEGDAQAVITNSLFIENVAGVFGGAVDIESDNSYIDNCSFIMNDASNGGAIGWIGANAVLINSQFINNTAGVGGAVFMQNMEYSISNGNLIQNCSFLMNEATEQGGAIEIENAQMYSSVEYTQIKNCEFIENTAYTGGAIAAYYGDTASLENTFINNSAAYGGAIASISTSFGISSIGQLYLRENNISDCLATESGNAIYNLGYIDSKLNIIFLDGNTVNIPDGKAIVLNVSVSDDMGNPISGIGLKFTVDGKPTILPASDLIEGIGTVRFVPRENGTFTVSGIYQRESDMYSWHNVLNGTILVENAIGDYFGRIYVSQDGDDDNTGSEDSPVKTFTQAYYLACREGGSYDVCVNEGSYEVYGYKLKHSFNVTGIGNVIFDSKNQASAFALYGASNDEFNISGITFVNGVASASDSGFYEGGAIFLKGGKLYLENDTFKSNSASDGGGAIYINQGFDYNGYGAYPASAVIVNCDFENNLVDTYGGAIGLYEVEVKIIDSRFKSNQAKYGGAIAIVGFTANITLINCSFTDNSALEFGGAVDLEAIDSPYRHYYVSIENSTFIHNKAAVGGAVIASTANITGCLFENNTGNNYGGALVLTDNVSYVKYSIFANNNANNGTAYYGNSSLINDNFWGANYNSSDEMIDSNLIYVDTAYDSINGTAPEEGKTSLEGPKTWINIKIDGLDKIEEGDYEYLVQFVLNDGDLVYLMRDYQINIANNDSSNALNESSLIIRDNLAKVTYSASKSVKDTIKVFSLIRDEFLDSLDIIVETAGNSKDLQDLIDKTKAGQTLDLGDKRFKNISNVNITKDITIRGGIIEGAESSVIFVIAPKSENGPDSVNITAVEFNALNGNVIVKAIAENDTNPRMIDVASINIVNNTISCGDDVVPASITVLEVDSDRAILAPTNELNVIGNTMESGVDPFNFVVSSLINGSEVNIPSGNLMNGLASEIICANMSTNAINVNLDGRNGEYFNFKLVDSDGNALANKPIVVGFNGHVYNYTTDENGSAKTQINLGVKGGYTFAISFLGDDEYNASFAVAKITVNPEPVKLTTAKKTYKASAKTKTLTATFKTSRGTAISGKKITFTVNGKSYTASTNKKGIATVKVSLSKKGTYSFTAKFAGDERYKAVSVKSTIKIS
uniref:Ig-like domain-containing protein n=1 Tax=uncultured Methanobrevibacter sp. TaxID=253161 RepID=UPI0026329E3B